MFDVVGAGLRELVFPAECAGCGRPGALLCLVCAPRCPPMETAGPNGLRVCSAAAYDGGLRTALLAYKERDRRELAVPLGALVARAAARLDGVLVPVPSTPEAVRRRGGDHVRRLALQAARTARAARPAGGRSLRVEPVLQVRRAVRDSAALGVAARRANLAGAFASRAPDGPLRRAIVVDDIVTTGATLAEAARALAGAGWTVTGAAVVAATPRRNGAAVSTAPPHALSATPSRRLADPLAGLR